MVCVHQDLFARLPEADHLLRDDSHPLQPGAAGRNAGAGHFGRTPSAGVDRCISRRQWPGGSPAHPPAVGPAALLKRELVETDSPYGKLRFGISLHALRFYFPRLWPEAEADAAA